MIKSNVIANICLSLYKLTTKKGDESWLAARLYIVMGLGANLMVITQFVGYEGLSSEGWKGWIETLVPFCLLYWIVYYYTQGIERVECSNKLVKKDILPVAWFFSSILIFPILYVII